mmetsp:Transcript_34088/g.89060  ORF Transcript_34088/g.89060 Transcript_34088/m.89060 type:complete len:216 (-) Transcript_34088:2127-2774(-)
MHKSSPNARMRISYVCNVQAFQRSGVLQILQLVAAAPSIVQPLQSDLRLYRETTTTPSRGRPSLAIPIAPRGPGPFRISVPFPSPSVAFPPPTPPRTTFLSSLRLPLLLGNILLLNALPMCGNRRLPVAVVFAFVAVTNLLRWCCRLLVAVVFAVVAAPSLLFSAPPTVALLLPRLLFFCLPISRTCAEPLIAGLLRLPSHRGRDCWGAPIRAFR